jgi:anti-sigma factor RsiW
MHLPDYALAGAALQLQNGDAPLLSPAAQTHLASCARCAARFDDLRATLGAHRDAAADAADAHFPQTTLDAQRDAILSRLAKRHAGARVLMFPTAAIHLPRSDRPAMRWVAGAVAAGLLVGVLTGQTLYIRDMLVSRVSQSAQAHVLRRQPLPHVTAESGPDAPIDERDENFLAELESALARSRGNPALRALDDMTPRAPGSQPRRRHRER